MEKLSDDILDNVTGGSEIRYSMDSDPLFSKFKNLWEKEEEKNGGSGMESRADLISSFKEWTSNGMPADINSKKSKK